MPRYYGDLSASSESDSDSDSDSSIRITRNHLDHESRAPGCHNGIEHASSRSSQSSAAEARHRVSNHPGAVANHRSWICDDANHAVLHHALSLDADDDVETRFEALWQRSVLHLDIDCFYCQCEEIDRDLRNRDPPPKLAIGQKHIVVTCNYEARRHGVTKLQLKSEALRKCPDLMIVDGSDLERYRRYSRKIYDAFREALRNVEQEHRSRHSQQVGMTKAIVAIQRGSGMDEMMADLSSLVGIADTCSDINSDDGVARADRTNVDPFVYGDGSCGDCETTLVEDQSGAVSIIRSTNRNGYNDQAIPKSRRNAHRVRMNLGRGGTSDGMGRLILEQQHNCRRRLMMCAHLALRVRKEVFDSTGFFTTIGVSVSPQLAKIAVDVKKPQSTNVLLPWRCHELMYEMPLRKVHTIGSRLLKALDQGLSDFHVVPSCANSLGIEGRLDGAVGRPKFWKVRHLLMLPYQTILRSVENLPSQQGVATHSSSNNNNNHSNNGSNSSSKKRCDSIIARCRGIDDTKVVDDGGALPKTVSVEDSFCRGTLVSMDRVFGALDQLLDRLPRLLRDRKSWSKQAEAGNPATLRVTIRFVLEAEQLHVGQNDRRRPFKTISKQCGMDGDCILQGSDLNRHSRRLKERAYPLLTHLLHTRGVNINITRLNLAVSNFGDVKQTEEKAQADKVDGEYGSDDGGTGGNFRAFFARTRPQRQTSQNEHMKRPPSQHAAQLLPPTRSSLEPPYSSRPSVGNHPRCWDDIDPSVLSQLPPDVAAEVRKSIPSQPPPKKTKRKTKHHIDDFFRRKR